MPKIIEFERSFASHPKAQFWSSKNDGRPEDYSLNSHKKFLFDCNKCGHEIEKTLLSINQGNTWCPYCYDIKLCGKCDKCYKKSFASQPNAIYWHDDNVCNPIDVFKATDKKFYFNCDKCPHKIYMSLKQITSQNHWCSYCSHHKLCDDNNCKICFNNSFASVEKNIFLYDKTINPRKIFKSTNKKYKFNCNRCTLTFDKILSDVTRGIWCPHCFNKTEEKLYNEIIKYYNINRQIRAEWCKNINTNKYLPFDFLIEDLKIIIEQDGPQHFKQVGKWQSPKITQINDLYKMNCANNNGYSIIRILQKDVWHDRYNWLEELIENINKIINDGIIQNIYMCKNNEYENFCNIDNIET